MKKAKGFTLIECIVAMAILAIASLVMAEIYANISMINKNNQIENTSLAKQMKYVEQKAGAETITIYFADSNTADTNTEPPHVSDRSRYLTIESDYSGFEYSYSTDVYALLSRDANDYNSSNASYKGETEDNYNLRYKYFLGHTN